MKSLSKAWIHDTVVKNGFHSPLEVKMLSLQRQGIEKIGDGFQELTQLESLDISRNSVSSLAGFEVLTSLTRLVLYYNRISNLSEVLYLKPLTKLKDLDLRLNPISRDDDCRKFVIHHLPWIERVDDRDVTNFERQRCRQMTFDHISLPKSVNLQGPVHISGLEALAALWTPKKDEATDWRSVQRDFEPIFGSASIGSPPSTDNAIPRIILGETQFSVADEPKPVEQSIEDMLSGLPSVDDIAIGVNLVGKIQALRRQDGDRTKGVAKIICDHLLSEHFRHEQSERVVAEKDTAIGTLQVQLSTEQSRCQAMSDRIRELEAEIVKKEPAPSGAVPPPNTLTAFTQTAVSADPPPVHVSVAAMEMLQQAHAQLVHTNQALLSELEFWKAKYASDATEWDNNFKELKQYVTTSPAVLHQQQHKTPSSKPKRKGPASSQRRKQPVFEWSEVNDAITALNAQRSELEDSLVKLEHS